MACTRKVVFFSASNAAASVTFFLLFLLVLACYSLLSKQMCRYRDLSNLISRLLLLWLQILLLLTLFLHFFRFTYTWETPKLLLNESRCIFNFFFLFYYTRATGFWLDWCSFMDFSGNVRIFVHMCIWHAIKENWQMLRFFNLLRINLIVDLLLNF